MSGRRDERGGIMVLVAVLLPLLLIVSAFAVDIGMQRVARRDMQAVADAVALDLGRLIDGRSAAAITAGTNGKLSLDGARAKSLERNDDHTLGDPPTVTATLINLDVQGLPELNVDGTIKQITGVAVPEAVLVSASTKVDFAFVTGSGGAIRTAIANSQSVACFRLGSFALALNSSNSSLLNSLLKDALQVQTLSYEGLVNSSISIAGLAAELNAGTVDELMALSNVSLRSLFLASATVLQREGGETADVNFLNTLAASVDLSKRINIAQLLSLSSGSSAALAGNLNILDLVSGSAFAANGENALGIGVIWNEPFISAGLVELRVIERPQQGCGPIGAIAKTAQVRFDASLPLHIPTILGLSATSTGIVIDADVAGATGILRSVTCGEGTLASKESIAVGVDKELVSLMMTAPIHLTGTTKLRLGDLGLDLGALDPLGLLNPNSLVDVTVDVTVQAGASTTYPGVVAGSSAATNYDVPPHTYNEPEAVGTAGSVELPSVSLDDTDLSGTAKVTILGVERSVALPKLGLVPELTSKIVEPALNPLIANINNTLRPLTELLGINANGADLFGVPRPACDSPALRG